MKSESTKAAKQVTESRRLLGHFSALLAGEAASKALRFAAAVVFARVLTVDDYGLLNVSIAIAGIAVIATNLGLPDQAARDILVAQAGRIPWLAGRVVSARVLATGSVCVVAMTTTAVVHPQALPFAALTAAMAMAMSASADWLLRGLEQMRLLGGAVALGGAAVLCGSLIVAAVAPALLPALAAMAMGELILSVACWLAWGRGSSPALGLQGVTAILRRSWPLAISSLALYMYVANLDTIILAAARSTEEAGLYSAAYRVFLAANTVSFFAGYAFLPVLSTAVEQGRNPATTETLRRTLRYLLAYGSAAVGVALLVGGEILEVLFGEQFGSMGEELVVLAIALSWYVVGFPVGYALIARQRNMGLLVGALLAAILNLALNFALIPPYGPMGAAAATAGSFAIASLAWARLHPELLGWDIGTVGLLLAVSITGVGALTVPGLTVPAGLGLLVLAAWTAGQALADSRHRRQVQG